MSLTSSPSETIRVIPVSADLVDFCWARVEGFLQKALDVGAGELWIEDVYRGLSVGEMQLLVAMDGTDIIAAIVTEVVDYPRKRALRILLCGGSQSRRWRAQLRDVLHAGAKAIGADAVESICRPGWEKILEPFPGVHTRAVIISENIRRSH